ncbi:hypothetical protein QFC24_006815 [Naganishia onofrii]|uniref:Uncharacterized protein n=1 Tax=Naganishia onofrii TaxID=1851511 RepID=A0ACC2WYI4_9TREE|nr:hypothetical protein QFC24_006815 [Naganishia onofrii]
MSTAIVPADRVGAEEQKKDVVVVTPDVVEPDHELLAEAPVKETATTPAFEHAESAVAPAGLTPAPPAMVAPAHATTGDHTDVVKPALEQPTEKATAPATTHESTETSSVPFVAAAGEPVVPVGNAKIEEAKEMKEIAKDSAKEAKGEKKTSSRSSSSSSADEANTTNATATKNDKPLPSLVPGTPTVTPATPSKNASPQVKPSTSTSSAAGVVPSVSATNEHPVPAKKDQAIDVNAVVERVEKMQLAEGDEMKGRDAEKPAVPQKDEAVVVKETHPAPMAAKEAVEASTSTTQAEDKKSKPSIAAPSPRVHRRISARIGQYIDHKFSNEKKKGSVPSSGVAESGVTTTGGDKGKDKESFVSGSAEPHLPTTHTHTTTSATAPTAAEVVGSDPPVLGAPVKVEPMGELEVKDGETVKPVAASNA